MIQILAFSAFLNGAAAEVAMQVRSLGLRPTGEKKSVAEKEHKSSNGIGHVKRHSSLCTHSAASTCLSVLQYRARPLQANPMAPGSAAIFVRVGETFFKLFCLLECSWLVASW